MQARPRLRGLHSHRLRRAEGRIIPHEALPAAEVRPVVDPLFDLHHIRADASFLHGPAGIRHPPCRIPVGVGHPGRQLQAQRLHCRPGLGVRDAGLRQSEQCLRTAGRGGRLPGVAGGQRRCLHALEVIGDPPQQDGVVQHVAALAAHRQRLAGVGQPFQCDHRAAAAQGRGLAVERLPGRPPHDAVHRQPRKPLVGPHGVLGGRTKAAVDAHRRDAGFIGAQEVEVELQLPHRRAAAAPPEDARILAGPQAGRQQFVGDVVVDLVQLVPGGAAHHAVAGQAEVGLEPLHRRCGRRTEPSIHSDVVQSGIDGVGDLEPELHEPHVLAAGPLPQGGAGIGVGGAVVRLDAPELVVDGVPGLAAHHNDFEKFLKEHGSNAIVKVGYGLSEASGFCSSTAPIDEKYVHNGTLGVPNPDIIIKIFEPNSDVEKCIDDIGEICVTGPTIFMGYINEDKETKNTLVRHHDGRTWLHTGDLGYMDKNGFIFYTSRAKRMIISNGYNIYPIELEEIIKKCKYVADCTVVAVPHKIKGQTPKAVIVLKKGIEDNLNIRTEIRKYCKENISRYAQPTEFEFRENIPVTAIGKVAYRDLEK